MQKRFYRTNVIGGISDHCGFSRRDSVTVVRLPAQERPTPVLGRIKGMGGCYDNASHSPYNSSSRLFRAA